MSASENSFDHYKDTGCEFQPKCLSCHISKCLDELPADKRNAMLELMLWMRDNRMRLLWIMGKKHVNLRTAVQWLKQREEALQVAN